MAPIRRPRLWDRFFQNFPPWTPRETCSLMCHTSGKLVGKRGPADDATGQRRWLSWLAAALTAIGMLLVLSKLALGETHARRIPAVTAVDAV